MKKKGPGRPKKRKFQNISEQMALPPEISQEILALVLGIVSIIILLSLFNLAGSFGFLIARNIKFLFGHGAYLLPIGLLIFSVNIFRQNEERQVKTIAWIGFGAFLVFLSGFIHLFISQSQALDVGKSGFGGGMIGYGVSHLFFGWFDFWISLLLFFALIIIGLIIGFNIKFASIIAWLNSLFKKDDEMGDEEPRMGFFARWRAAREQRRKNKKLCETKPITTTADKNWKLPPIDILDDKVSRPSSGDVKKNMEVIQKTLQTFNIEVKMGDVNIGPTVAQYTLKPLTGVKLNQITARANDLALNLAAHPIRIEAPIPGKSAVGVKVPNKVPALVRIREMLESQQYSQVKSKLGFMLGRDVAGIPISVNLDKMPHLLIAGSTGSGKSVCIHSIVTSLLYRNSPQDLRFLFIDPKRVELTQYNGIPHLLTETVVDVDKTINALKWAVSEMERRYQVLSEAGKKDIISFNKDNQEKIPYIVIIIDELADLMASAAREVENSIVRIAQMARAVGIHLIVATQRPSVDVITGLIKANITSRIAFAVASQVDSRTILDSSGAEKLLGNGDMLYLASDVGKPKRIQGVFISEKEVGNVKKFLEEQAVPEYNEEIVQFRKSKAFCDKDIPEDEMFDDAVEVVVKARKASASLLQRRLRVGYARAARLLDILEDKGVIGPADGAKPRDVLIDENGTYEFDDK